MELSFRSTGQPSVGGTFGFGWKNRATWYDARVKTFGLLPVLLLAGCCSTFDRDFEAARSATAGSAPLAGCWEGTWHSDPSGHAGGLRSIITQTDSGFSARYDATFTFILPLSFEYEVPLTVLQDRDAWRFRGSAVIDYCIAGGLYEYEGLVSGDEFVASYRSSFDSGVFRMKRVRR
jgi:hypothetical protein